MDDREDADGGDLAAGRDAIALIELGPEERTLLREAAELAGINEPGEIVRLALTEFLERRRFQSWVARLEQNAHGSA
jgi:hypothetical protein